MALNLRNLAHMHAAEQNSSLRRDAELLCDELRNTFCDDVDCFAYRLEVRVFGSVHNDTYILGSDADIAVIPTGCSGTVQPSRGPGQETVCNVFEFREHLCKHLRRRFGERFVCQQRKAILLCGTAQRIRADVVVLLPRLWQHSICPTCGKPQCSHGYELRSTRTPEYAISTWPEQHHENARAFDVKTNGRYKLSVRSLKGILRYGAEHSSEVASIANLIPPILVENLFACVPEECYHYAGSCPFDVLTHIVKRLIREFATGSAAGFRELSGMRALFDSSQTWDIPRSYDCLRRLSWLLAGS